MSEQTNPIISFKNFSFQYRAQKKPTLHDINLDIYPGERVLIAGPSGSGKSTLTYLLDRLYELPEGSGEITIGGVDIRNIALSHLRGNIGIVLQEPFLFSKSFKDTISDGSNRHDIESVRKYARLAVIDDTIDRFAEGYDTQIGERGVTISGGQKQRLTIARALVGHPRLLILDDSMSALDYATDLELRRQLASKMGDVTKIVISQRATSIQHADHILVMDDGKCVGYGTHDALLEQCPVYADIYRTQMQ